MSRKTWLGSLFARSHDSARREQYCQLTFEPLEQRTMLTTLFLLAFTLGGMSSSAQADLLVSSNLTNEVLRYEETTGGFLGVFASGSGLSGPSGLVFGPDNNLYVGSLNTNDVLRYDGTTGAFIDVFTSGGGLDLPTFITFTPTIALLGDFDSDNDVDGADFLTWQRGFPTLYNATDLANWENEYGQTIMPAAVAATIPEPSSAMLLLTAVACGLCLRQHSRKGSS